MKPLDVIDSQNHIRKKTGHHLFNWYKNHEIISSNKTAYYDPKYYINHVDNRKTLNLV